MKPLLSVLIPTLEERQPQLELLLNDLLAQRAKLSAPQAVEIITCTDRRQLSTGEKRNLLVQHATGEFICFIDDDDRISAAYLEAVLNTIVENPQVDCIDIQGVMRFKAGQERCFEYALTHRFYHSCQRVICRPPHHLNPIRRDIMEQHPFLPITRHEDSAQAMQMVHDRAIKSSAPLEGVSYVYESNQNYLWFVLLEVSEFIRRPLGLEVRRLAWLKGRKAANSAAAENAPLPADMPKLDVISRDG